MNGMTLNWLCQRLKIKPEEIFALKIYNPEPIYFDGESIAHFSFIGYPTYEKKVIFMRRAGRKKIKRIYIPSPNLKKIQKALLKEVLIPFLKLFEKKHDYDFLQYAHGCIAGRSIISNILPHLKNRYFWVTDIDDAYYSTPTYYILAALKELGFYPDVAKTIIALTTRKRQLIMGPPTSPFLFNITLAHFLDKRIVDLLRIAEKKYGLPQFTYSRYFDDIIISNQTEIPKIVIKELTQLIEAFYRLQKNKTHYVDISKIPLEITGLTLTSQGLKLPKRKRENMEILLYMAIHNPEKFYPIIMGKMGQFKQVYNLCNLPSKIDRLLEQFDMAYASQKNPS
jgi:hypothetical protein